MAKMFCLNNFLIASPYNIDTNLQGTLTEDLFYQKYFIKSSTYEVLNKSMDSALNSHILPLPISIFLYGYNGTGKTTYLKWYAKNYINNYNKIFFDLKDAVLDNDSCMDCLKLFDDYFYYLICNIFSYYPKTINNLLFTLFHLQLRITNAFTPKFFYKLKRYIDETKHVDVDDTAFINLTSGCSYKDLMTLLLFYYYNYPDEFGQFFGISINKELPLLMIFDNINHVEIDLYNSEFPKVIESVYQNVKRTQKESNIKINKDIIFIFCTSDINCSLMNCQSANTSVRYNIEFRPLAEESEIIFKRILIAKQHAVKVNQQQEEFLEYILNEEFTKRSFLPLFNFNIRKLAKILCEITEESDPTYFVNIKKLSKSASTRYGSRGIEYFLVIKYLLKNDYLKERLFLNNESLIVGCHAGYVNPARLLLTDILNKSQYSLDEYTRTAKSNPVGLYNLFCTFDEIFVGSIDLYFGILTNLFLLNKENWCNLITFINKQVFSEDSFSDEKKALKKLITQPNDSNITDINKLNDIKIRLNPAGFVYIRDITRHYEFFSFRVGNENPLFCSLGYENKGNDIEFEFIKNIKNTFKFAKERIDLLITFLETRSADNFESSNHCFRTYNNYDIFEDDTFVRRRSILHSIRIIDSHISYIDGFRCFILNNGSYLSTIAASNIRTVKSNINKEIIDMIEQYVSLLIQINENTGYTQNLISVFEKNISIIKQSKYADCLTSVNHGRTL
ncbi:hypothetical protein [Methanosarcina acetivorans]|nr:hypothetical protein [Methanosarcina acetivorans]